MSQLGFEEFKKHVLADDALQRRIRDIAVRPEFIQETLELAVEHGFEVDREDVEEALRRGNQAWIERWV
jgi:ATP-dependent Clp protease ATP-binding subunit ClpA